MTFVVLPRTMGKLTAVLQALVVFLMVWRFRNYMHWLLHLNLQTLQPGRINRACGRICNALKSHNTVGSLVSAIFQCLRFVSSSFRMLPIIMTRHHSGIISCCPSFLPTISINFYGRFLSISTLSQEDATVAHFCLAPSSAYSTWLVVVVTLCHVGHK